MRLPYQAFILVALHSSGLLADHLIGPMPAPTDFNSDYSLLAASWRNLTSILDDLVQGKIAQPSGSAVGNVTFSLGLFSLHDPAATKLQYHHTSVEIRNAPAGTTEVNETSIYRVASVSKLITALAGMIVLCPEDWNRPLSDIIPDLQDYVRAHMGRSDPIDSIRWDKITPWALATQLSGIPTYGWPAADLAVRLTPSGQEESTEAEAYGLRPINITTLGPCASNNSYCSASEGVQAVENQHPNVLPWTTPIYSDLGFMLLGIAISRISRRPLTDIYHDHVFTPLDMASSSDTHPTGGTELSRSVIISPDFEREPGFTTPSGGILSTLDDLTKLGTGIMNNTLLSAETTRKWMKPATHSASFSYSFGGPWEIHRYVNPDTGRSTELYTKLGDSGSYGAALVLIPQYDAGFAMLNAFSGAARSYTALVILDYVTNTILPALEAQAITEARKNYVGTYISTSKDVNSSVTITFNESSVAGIDPSLSLSGWILNGVDIMKAYYQGGKPRLELFIPKQTSPSSPGQVAFQASLAPQFLTYTAAMGIPELGIMGPWTGLYGTNADAVEIDQDRYGGVGVNMFVFNVDGEGRATSCSPCVTGATLQRAEAQ